MSKENYDDLELKIKLLRQLKRFARELEEEDVIFSYRVLEKLFTYGGYYSPQLTNVIPDYNSNELLTIFKETSKIKIERLEKEIKELAKEVSDE